MAFTFADVQTQYEKDKNLKKEDVKAVLEWADKQPHLPQINELQAILFLHSCYFSNERAKATIDNFFTVKTIEADIFQNRDASSLPIQRMIDICVMTLLPKKTPEGYTVFYLTAINRNSEKFVPAAAIKLFDMIAMLELHQGGVWDGVAVILDMKNVTWGHFLKLSPVVVKKLLYYVQEALPLRLKAIHFVNTVSFMDKIMALIKPFLKKELMDILHFHETVDDLEKVLPRECLPEDLGGGCGSIASLREKWIHRLMSNQQFFEWEETLKVDESKRMEKRKDYDNYGADGTFKKLAID